MVVFGSQLPDVLLVAIRHMRFRRVWVGFAAHFPHHFLQLAITQSFAISDCVMSTAWWAKRGPAFGHITTGFLSRNEWMIWPLIKCVQHGPGISMVNSAKTPSRRSVVKNLISVMAWHHG